MSASHARYRHVGGHVELRRDLADDLRRRLAALAPHVTPTEESTFPELGLDSADVLELVAGLEDDHGIAVPLDGLRRVRTFGQLVDHLTTLVAARAGTP